LSASLCRAFVGAGRTRGRGALEAKTHEASADNVEQRSIRSALAGLVRRIGVA
jgi:hypothetical protein